MMPASSLTFVKKPDKRAIHYLSHMSYNKFKTVSAKKCKNEKDRFECFNAMKRYVEYALEHDCTIECKYEYSSSTPKALGGRLFAHHSIQQVACEIRGLLFKHTTDIDMVNCHATLLLYLCAKNNVKHECLKRFVNNRDELLSNLNMERNEAKTAFISAINNSKKNYKIQDSFFREFDNEIKEIQQILASFPDYKPYRDAVPDDKNDNEIGCTLNRILCGFENEVIQHCIELLRPNYTISTLMYDGLMIEGNHYNNPELLRDIEKHIESCYPGLNMHFSYKPHDTTIQIPDEFVIDNMNMPSLTPCQEKMMINQNHKSCADVIYELFDDIYVCVDKNADRWYKYNEQTALWETGEQVSIRATIYDTLFDIVETANSKLEKQYDALLKVDKDSQEVKNIKKLLTSNNHFKRSLGSQSFINGVQSFLRDQLFVSNFETKINKQINMLPLADGTVINLKTNKTNPRTKTDYFSVACNVVYEPENTTYGEQYFSSLFPDENTKQCVLNILKTSLTGNPIRNIFVWIGTGCNGKSLLLKVLRKMLSENFCGIVSKNVIIQPSNASNITSELEDLSKYRFAQVSEISDADKVYQTRIKEFTGDGVIKYRGLWKKDTTLEVVSTVHIATNEMLAFDCRDRAMLTRIIPVPFKAVFVPNSEYEVGVMNNINSIFSYIIKFGNVQKSFNIFEMSDEIQKSRKEEIEMKDLLVMFITDHIVASKNDMKYEDFVNKYNEYLLNINLINHESSKSIFKTLRGFGYAVKRSNSVCYIQNCDFKVINTVETIE